MTKKKGPTHFFSNIEPRGRRRRETTNNMEDAFARSIGEVESHFDGVFFFSFSRVFGVGGLGVKRSTESAKREEEEEG